MMGEIIEYIEPYTTVILGGVMDKMERVDHVANFIGRQEGITQ